MDYRENRIVNALTFDVEDWYQVSNFDEIIGFDRWEHCESRLEPAVDRILSVLREHEVKATFFVLGWNAERFPRVVEKIAADRHEIGTHGYRHALVYNQTPAQFADDVGRSLDALERITGVRCHGHRAASFSITRRSWWALEILQELGISYDSSVFPIRHHRYGVPEGERFPHWVTLNGGRIQEFPISTVRRLGRNVPFSGGGYFRFLPGRAIAGGIRALNHAGKPAVVYLHPWEFDPDQPRPTGLGRSKSFRCYVGLKHTEQKLRRLLQEFRFGPAYQVLKACLNQPVTVPELLAFSLDQRSQMSEGSAEEAWAAETATR